MYITLIANVCSHTFDFFRIVPDLPEVVFLTKLYVYLYFRTPKTLAADTVRPGTYWPIDGLHFVSFLKITKLAHISGYFSTVKLMYA
jgi:hypothetical protein